MTNMLRVLSLALALLAWAGSPALAQKTPAQLITEINTLFPDNSIGAITPAKLRQVTTDMVNSNAAFQAPLGQFPIGKGPGEVGFGSTPAGRLYNLAANPQFYQWSAKPCASNATCTVTTPGSGVGFSAEQIADGWYAGPGPSGVMTFSQISTGSSLVTISGFYSSYYAGFVWTTGPTCSASICDPGEYTTSSRATYLEQNANEPPERALDQTWTFSINLRLQGSGLTTATVAPVLYYSSGAVNWIAGQTKNQNDYVQNTVGGVVYVWQKQDAGSCTTGAPSPTTLSGTHADGGGCNWTFINPAKGTSYDIYEGNTVAGTVNATTYTGTPASGSTCSVTTSWSLCRVTITLPAPGYINSSAYAGSGYSPRTLIPPVDNTAFGGVKPYIGIGLDIVSIPTTNTELDIADVCVSPSSTAIDCGFPQRRIEPFLSAQQCNPSSNAFANRTSVADVAYTVLLTDCVIAYTSISAARVVTLPNAAAWPYGRALVIYDTSGSASSTNKISIAPNGANTINGSNSTQAVITVPYGAVTLYAENTNWAVNKAPGFGLFSCASGAIPVGQGTTSPLGCSSLPTLATGVILGTAGGATGQARFTGTTSGVVTMQSQDVAGTWTFKLPATAGTNTYALTTDGSGVSAWSQIGLTTAVTGTLPVGNGGTGTGTAFTAGSVVFAGASGVYSQNNAVFFWDNSNGRLGIGNAAPGNDLDVKRSSTGNVVIAVQNTGVGAGATGSFNVFNGQTQGISTVVASDAGGGLTTLLGTSSGGMTMYTNNATSLSFGTNGNNTRLVIDSTGNVTAGVSLISSAYVSVGTKIRAAGSAPALTSCGGGSPAITGSDLSGEVTMGTTATGCVITFNVTYSSAPYCTVTWQATPLASQSYVVAADKITLTQTSTSSNKVNYTCVARSAGWLLKRDLNPAANDNTPAFMENAA